MIWAFDGMVKLLWTRACPVGTLYLDYCKRVRAIQARLVAIVALVAAGTLPVPRAYVPHRRSGRGAAARPTRPEARSVRPGVPVGFPADFGWLGKMLRHELATFTMAFVYGIQTPEMQALMKAAPEVGDLFRELFFAGGVLGDAKPFLPPTRGQRYRQRRAAYRAAQSATVQSATAPDATAPDAAAPAAGATDQAAADAAATNQPAPDRAAPDQPGDAPQPTAAPNPRRARRRAAKRTHETIDAAGRAKSSKT